MNWPGPRKLLATRWWIAAICVNSIKLADLTLLSAAGHIKLARLDASVGQNRWGEYKQTKQATENKTKQAAENKKAQTNKQKRKVTKRCFCFSQTGP